MQQSFIDTIAPFAIKHGRANGILSSVLISQGILESSWAQSSLAKNANNLFGIKASNWNGKTYEVVTGEYDKIGNYFKIVAAFRAYDSYEGAVIDLCDKYVKGLPNEKVNRYQAVVGEKDYKKATEAIYKAGYATDPQYPQKLNNIIEKYDLTKYDKEEDVMSYTIVNNFLPVSKYPLKATYTMNAKYITVHNTANDASAVNEIKYMSNNTSSTSYHVAIDDKEAIHAIPFNRNAWHCGDGSALNSGNRNSIGIEICYSKSGGDRYKKAEANAVEYIAHLLKHLGWDVSRVKFHQEWARPSDGYRKNCPHRILDEKRGDSFKKAIATRLAVLNGVASTPLPTPSKPQETIKPKEENLLMAILKGTSGTLNNAFLKYLEDAAKKGVILDKWAKSYKAGELTMDDAFLLYVYIKEELNK